MVAGIRTVDTAAAGAAIKVQEHSGKNAVFPEIFLDLVIKDDRLLGVHLEEGIRRDPENAVTEDLTDRCLAPDIRPDTFGVLPLCAGRALLRPDADDPHAVFGVFQGFRSCLHKSIWAC